MAGFRAYFDFNSYNNEDFITLSEDESNHLCGSLRAEENDDVDVFDLHGNIYKCKIASPHKKHTVVKILEKIPPEIKDTEVYLLQCLPKGKTFDDIIRQSVEIGASGIYPIISQFSQIKLDQKDIEKKLNKWRAQVLEAIKQSSNFSGFDIFKPTSFNETLQNLPDFDLKIVASLEDNSKKIADIFKKLQTTPKKTAILIGPEGDMSNQEYKLANSMGFVPATLGKNVLKSETAALTAIAQVLNASDFIRD